MLPKTLLVIVITLTLLAHGATAAPSLVTKSPDPIGIEGFPDEYPDCNGPVGTEGLADARSPQTSTAKVGISIRRDSQLEWECDASQLPRNSDNWQFMTLADAEPTWERLPRISS